MLITFKILLQMWEHLWEYLCIKSKFVIQKSECLELICHSLGTLRNIDRTQNYSFLSQIRVFDV